MSTRAVIAVADPQVGFQAIYLHFDGYPGYTGQILYEHHNSLALAGALICGGDIRSLETNGTLERFVDGNGPYKLPTRAALLEFARNYHAEYVYVFEDGTWHCRGL